MHSKVYETLEHPSIPQSVPSTDSSSPTAAERHVGWRYRSTAAGAGAQQHWRRSTALSSKNRQSC